MARVTFTSNDRKGDPTSMQIHADDAVLDASVQAVADAIDAVILGTAVRAVVTTDNIVDGGTGGKSADKDADRGQKWAITMQRADGKTLTHYLGTADSAQLPAADSDGLDLTAGVGLALKTAIDAIYEDADGDAYVCVKVNKVFQAIN